MVLNRDLLIVEDNPADVRLMQEALRTLEPAVDLHIASDGEDALRFLRRQGRFASAPRPRLIFLDFNLPKAGSREILRQIKGDAALRVIPIAVLTSSDSEKDIIDAYELHANCYLTKASDLESFFHIIRWSTYFWLDIATPAPAAAQTTDPVAFGADL